MMPPHVTQTSPPDNATLHGNTVEIRGYTLSAVDLDEELAVVDENTGKPVAYDVELKTTTEGPEGSPGSRQEHATLHVVLEHTVGGHVYRLSLLDTTIRVTAASPPE